MQSRVSINRKREVEEEVRVMQCWKARGWLLRTLKIEEVPTSKKCRPPPDAAKSKETDSPWKLLEKNAALASPLMSAHRVLFWISKLQNWELIHSCCFKTLSLCQFVIAGMETMCNSHPHWGAISHNERKRPARKRR